MRSKVEKLFGMMFLMSLFMGMGEKQIILARDIEMEVKYGIQKEYKVGKYIPVSVNIQNGATDFKGYVKAWMEYADTEYSEVISIPANETKKVTIPVLAQDENAKRIIVTLEDEKGNRVLKKSVANNYGWNEQMEIVGVLSDQVDDVKYMGDMPLITKGYFNNTQLLTLNTEDISENVRAIEMLDVIVIDNFDTSSFLPEQLKALRSWVIQGGVLVVGTGSKVNKTLSGLAKEVVPVVPEGVSTRSVKLLGENIDLDLADFKKVQQVEVSAEGTEQTNKGQCSQLYQNFKLGDGNIIIMRCEIGSPKISEFDQRELLWHEVFFDQGSSRENINRRYYNLWDYLGEVRSEHLLDTKILIGIFGIYLGLLSVGCYFILKHMGKNEYILWVAPLVAIMVTSVIYALSLKSRLAPFIINGLEVINIDTKGTATSNMNVTVLNTHGKAYKIEEPEDTYFAKITSRMAYERGENREERVSQMQYEAGQMTYIKKQGGIFDSELFITAPKMVEKPNYQCDITHIKNNPSAENGNFEVKFENKSDVAIEHLLVAYGSRVWDLGSVPVGGKIEKDNIAGNHLFNIDDIYMAEKKYEDDLERLELCHVAMLAGDFEHREQYVVPQPMYMAVMKRTDAMLAVNGDSDSEFNYTVVKETIDMQQREGEISYPYGYFMPELAGDLSQGSIRSERTGMLLEGSGEIILNYPVKVNCKIERITVGTDYDRMQDLQGTALNGQVYIYNYTSGQFKSIDVIGKDGYSITGDSIKDYMQGENIMLKVVAKDEKQGLLPSVSIGGRS